MTEMFQVIELIYDKDERAVDYYYRDVNLAFEKLVGKTREQLVDKRVKDIFGIVEDYWLELYDKVLRLVSLLILRIMVRNLINGMPSTLGNQMKNK